MYPSSWKPCVSGLFCQHSKRNSPVSLGAYNAVGQCQSADTEHKTSQYFAMHQRIVLRIPRTHTGLLSHSVVPARNIYPSNWTFVRCIAETRNTKGNAGGGQQKGPKWVWRPRIRICVSADREFKTQACRTREAVQCVWRSCRIKLAGSACAAAVCWAARGHRRPAPRRIPQWRRGGASKCCGPSWIGISAGNDSGILYARCAEATHFLGIGAGKDKRTDSGIVYARGEEATHFLTYALTIALHT